MVVKVLSYMLFIRLLTALCKDAIFKKHCHWFIRESHQHSCGPSQMLVERRGRLLACFLSASWEEN